jgi:hypothetical protein
VVDDSLSSHTALWFDENFLFFRSGFVNNTPAFLTTEVTRTYERSLVFPLCFPQDDGQSSNLEDSCGLNGEMCYPSQALEIAKD